MAIVSEEELAIARVYAGALLEVATEGGKAEVVGDELRELAKCATQQPEFATFLASPTIDSTSRAASLEKMFRDGLDDILTSALQVLNRRERLGLLPAIASAFVKLVDEGRGRTEVEVRAATALTAAAREQLKKALAGVTNRQVDLVETIDESMIGGLIVQFGDWRYDLSVRTKLQHVREAVLDRMVHEAQAGRTFVAV